MSPWAFLTNSSFRFDLFISDSGSAYWGIFLEAKLATYLKWHIVCTSCLSWCNSVSENTGTIWCSYSSIFRGACFLNCWWHKKIKNFLAIWKKELLEIIKTRRGLLSNNNKTHVYLTYLMLQANASPHCQTLDIINTCTVWFVPRPSYQADWTPSLPISPLRSQLYLKVWLFIFLWFRNFKLGSIDTLGRLFLCCQENGTTLNLVRLEQHSCSTCPIFWEITKTSSKCWQMSRGVVDTHLQSDQVQWPCFMLLRSRTW